MRMMEHDFASDAAFWRYLERNWPAYVHRQFRHPDHQVVRKIIEFFAIHDEVCLCEHDGVIVSKSRSIFYGEVVNDVV